MSKKSLSPIIYVGLWLLLTISLTGWWLIYGLKQVAKLAQANQETASELLRQQRMLLLEGGFLLLLLLGGGIALFYFIRREYRRTDLMRQFFATFTHELKTPLASLRLQAESLQEDLQGTNHSRLAERLVKDTGRLELQLENSLLLSTITSASELHIEPVTLSTILKPIRQTWLDIPVEVEKDCVLKADPRALESVLKNIFQNARTHGEATRVGIKVRQDGKFVNLKVEDNGRGFQGNPTRLGLLFYKHYPRSGSGVGLFISKQLVEKMHGSLSFAPNIKKGFGVELKLQGQVL